MNKKHLIFLLFLTFTQIQCSKLDITRDSVGLNTQLQKALLENDGETLTAVIEKYPFVALKTNDIETAIARKCFSSLKALAKIVNTNPKMLARFGLKENLDFLSQFHLKTLLMRAMSSSKEIAIILLSIPSIAESINYFVTTTNSLG